MKLIRPHNVVWQRCGAVWRGFWRPVHPLAELHLLAHPPVGGTRSPPPLPCVFRLHSANADDAQTAWRRAGGAAGERRGGCATVTEPTETDDIAALRVMANAGDAEAQLSLGVMYANEHVVPQDYAQAVAWYRKAAEQGHAAAQFNLGFAYKYGEGVPQDAAQAVAWYRKAAEQGDALDQFNLGTMYRDGEGVPQDYGQAAAWYRKAAEQGYAIAQSSLGYAYELGQGVPQDYVEAHKWFNLAASRASAENQKQYAEGRDALAKVMTPTQIEAAQTLAREWMAAFQKRGGK